MASFPFPLQVAPEDFEKAFGAPPSQLSELLEAKSVTIGRLMEIAPYVSHDRLVYRLDDSGEGLYHSAESCN